MKQVALYGKGGIGKSTTSANISYLLSKNGKHVVQVGCDPKHDSTRLLLSGKTQLTVLDHLSSNSKNHLEVISHGKNSVTCIETGGPEPGVGCAGRGILTAFDFIREHSLIPDNTDVVLYDVLGDVVCGGFAVPLRKQYANVVFIVTSGEFMSLYAANNVLKGIRNFDGDDKRVAGLILNSRGNEGEYEYVKNFADAVGLPIVSVVPRSKKFSVAESGGMTISEMFPDSEETASYLPIIKLIEDELDGISDLHPASPLNDEELDLVAKGVKVRRSGNSVFTNRVLAIDDRSTLKSCGIRAAARCCMEILDSEIIAHGPMSCAYMYGNVYDRGLMYQGKTHIPSINKRLFSTNLDDCASIYGGGKQLETLIRSRVEAGAKLLFVMPACVPGIIGDDTENICRKIESENPGTRIIPVPMDGILCGGAIQGKDMAVGRICDLVDPSVEPDRSLVNIIGHHDTDDRILDKCDDTERILNALGISIHCRFLDENYYEDVRNLRKGSLNLMFSQSVGILREAKVIQKKTGIRYYEHPLPHGLRDTVKWIRGFSKDVGVSNEVCEDLCADLAKQYDAELSKIKDSVRGLTTIVYTDSSSDIDWLLEVLDHIGVRVLEIMCPVNSVWNFAEDELSTAFAIPIKYNTNLNDLENDVFELKPSFIIGSQPTLSTLDCPHYVIERPRPGISSCIEYARRIVRMYKVNKYGSN